MPKGKGYETPRTIYDDGTQAVSRDYETPHQKVLEGGIGIEKASGQGNFGGSSTTAIGISSMGNHKKKTTTKMSY